MSLPERTGNQQFALYMPEKGIGGESNDQPESINSPDLPEQLEPYSLRGIDFGDRTTWNKVIATVHELQKYDAKDPATNLLGLPEAITWSDIEAYIDNQDFVYLARDYGLSEDAPQELIQEYLLQEEEKQYLLRAKELGLPEDATGEQISEKERRVRAKGNALSEDAVWGDIWKAEKEQKRKIVFKALGVQEELAWDWEDIACHALCLPSGTSTEVFVKRIKEVREWHIDRIIKEEQDLFTGQ